MGYPRIIQPLVVEDEQSAKDYYEAVFQELRKKHAVLPPHFAFCESDAIELLAREQIYHLVLLDLCLPERPNQPPPESINFGHAILKECIHRNAYPIPALLIISGNLQLANQTELSEQVESGFAHGRVLVKSDNLEAEIKDAVTKCEQYSDVGIHIRNSEDKLFPALSPRDIDLLVRSQTKLNSVGVDIGWWTADYSPHAGWTKVLCGRFLLDEGRGHSLYSFFKFTNREGATTVFREADVMTQKLKHIKVIDALASGDRSLLITQSAGKGTCPPTSLGYLLCQPAADVNSAIIVAAQTIAQQISLLGDRSPDRCVSSKLLWDHHSIENLADQWRERGGAAVLEEFGLSHSPIDIAASIKRRAINVRYIKQNCRHGDLNYTNVALDRDRKGDYAAFVFDASGCSPGACVRDLAMLEVTTLLHQSSGEGTCLVLECMDLYAPESEQMVADGQSGLSTNTRTLIQAIRKEAHELDDEKIYALLVFDNALIQFGGLGYGSSFNKIQNPKDAVTLLALTSNWLLRHFPVLSE